ncbi:flagellar basal-body rod modification protein FlgD [Clostridium pascui]|uniref:flagellar hook capping FlgD N-terminal domain-containing protein n=1 Tax=Clostridium pascui TaxID=46609 RepID=UPI00195DB70D|nr:flagellar hook capping FlgD N-terminal domain-containing protein [Clostridium pascui]MBM7869412.1 flagellar basal-body rod modification protein FlgD [Clostridium pascui]
MAETTGVNTQNQAYSSTKTNRGTKIVKGGGELDKNAFLQILAAELTNQDPLSGGKDGTEYVAQMAQFANLEQMTNMNTSMNFSGASSLIGKTVMIDSINDKGKYHVGTVTGVSRDGSVVRVNVNVGKIKLENGTEIDDIRQFMYSSVIEVVETPKGSEDNVETPNSSEEENERENV